MTGVVCLPETCNNWEKQRLIKIFLDPSKTSVPDPLLLLIKAAIGWSSRCGQQLLHGCGLNEEDLIGKDHFSSRIEFFPYIMFPEAK